MYDDSELPPTQLISEEEEDSDYADEVPLPPHPVYRDLVPVHPGFSFRAMNQTPQKPEWKYIDTYSLTAPIVPNYGAAIWVLLNGCVADLV